MGDTIKRRLTHSFGVPSAFIPAHLYLDPDTDVDTEMPPAQRRRSNKARATRKPVDDHSMDVDEANGDESIETEFSLQESIEEDESMTEDAIPAPVAPYRHPGFIAINQPSPSAVYKPVVRFRRCRSAVINQPASDAAASQPSQPSQSSHSERNRKRQTEQIVPAEVTNGPLVPFNNPATFKLHASGLGNGAIEALLQNNRRLLQSVGDETAVLEQILRKRTNDEKSIAQSQARPAASTHQRSASWIAAQSKLRATHCHPDYAYNTPVDPRLPRRGTTTIATRTQRCREARGEGKHGFGALD